MWLACPLVGWFLVGAWGAVDEDEVSLLDRFVSLPGRKSRTVLRRMVIRRQDSGDRGLGDSQEVGDHHLGQVLAKDQQAGHHLVP